MVGSAQACPTIHAGKEGVISTTTRVSTEAEAKPARATRSKWNRTGNWRDTLLAILFVTPGLVLVLLFKLIPLFEGFIGSLYKTTGFEGSTFTGVDNYTRMTDDPTVIGTFKNAALVALTLPIWVFLPLILALMLYRRAPGWTFFRSVYFIPYIVAPIVVGVMFRQILNPDGPLNESLRLVGLDGLALEWLQNQNTALWSLVAVALWSFFGFGVLTYLAGLSTVSREVLEAAMLDGAGFWRLLVSVIIPMIRPVMGYWTLLCASGLLIWMFPLIYALTQGGPGITTMLPEYLVFLTTFQFLDRGYGSAIGMALFFTVAMFSAFSVRHLFQQVKAR